MAPSYPTTGAESRALPFAPPELRLSHQERNRLTVARHIDKDPVAYRAKCRQHERERFAADPTYRESKRLRNMLRYAMARLKAGKWFGYSHRLGYSGPELRRHIESQWQDGMTWENYGTVWTMDHIVPVSVMLFNGVTDSLAIHALENLRPMPKFENASKSNKDAPTVPTYPRERSEYTGEKHHLSKLTADDVRQIKGRLREGRHGIISQLAREYGVAVNTIQQIKQGIAWKDVE